MTATLDFTNCDCCRYFNRQMFWCSYYNQPVKCNLDLRPLGCAECIKSMKRKEEEKTNESKNYS